MSSPQRKLNLRLIWLAPLVLIGGALAAAMIWLAIPASQMPEADSYLQSTESVEVTSGRWLTFEPTDTDPQIGLILYPGGRVTPAAYAPAAYQIAEAGTLVIIPAMPFNLAVFDVDAASEVIAQYPAITHWVIGGHSLGGSMAASYAAEHPDQIEGLVLWASYPAASTDFSDTNLAAISIYGSLDSQVVEIRAAGERLPPSTDWVEIAGGNHAQFGWYGSQAGDNAPEITRADQQRQIVDATVDFLTDLQSELALVVGR